MSRLDTYGPTALVAAAVDVLESRSYEPLAVDTLFRDAWDGAASALLRAGASAVPPAPAYPVDPTGARALHEATFPELEALAVSKLPSDERPRRAREDRGQRKREHRSTRMLRSRLVL